MLYKQNILILQIIVILYWLIFLLQSDSYYVIYLIIGILSYVFLDKNRKDCEQVFSNKDNYLIIVFSIIFSGIIIAANYAIFFQIIQERGFFHIYFPFIGSFLGGFFAFYNVIVYIIRYSHNFYWKKSYNKFRPIIIFSFSVIVIIGIDLLILFLCEYPGILTYDSVFQINQCLSNSYSNHHPFYHTMIIKIFLFIGIKIFHDINIGIVIYNIFQIIFMASCFSYTIVTLYEMKISLKILSVCWIFYVIMPFHIKYSFTMWKDVIFGAFVLVFSLSIFRILKSIGNEILNYMLVSIGSIGMCLFRSNGWFAFLITFFGFVFLYRKQYKKVKIIFMISLAFTFILKHPILDYLGVSQVSTIEALSIPAQQIARVISTCNDLTDEQKELLEKIIEIEKVSEAYTPYISDPVKYLFKNEEYLLQHKGKYLKLYFEIGIAHPVQYIEAWIDQTKGYWNGGYLYGIWGTGILENQFGIKNIVYSKGLNKIWNKYCSLYFAPLLQVFVSIGFYVWIIAVIGLISIIRRNKDTLFLTIPLFAIVISLLITTPVYSEFRYAYALFCCVPFLIFAPFYKDTNFEAKENIKNG